METIITTIDTNEAIAIEKSLPPGNYMVTMQTEEPLSRDIIIKMQSEMQSHGINLLCDISQTGTYPNVVGISYSKPAGIGNPIAVAVISIIVPVAIIGTVIWGINRIEKITTSILPILLLILGTVIILGTVLREPIGKYIGGKV